MLIQSDEHATRRHLENLMNFDPEMTDIDPMIIRIKKRHDQDVRRRRSLFIGVFCGVCVWLVSGTISHGTSWLIGLFSGAGVALAISAGLTLRVLSYIRRLDAASGARSDSPRQARHILIGAFVGNALLCISVFAAYQSSIDFGRNREGTLINCLLAAVTFVIASIIASFAWRTTARPT